MTQGKRLISALALVAAALAAGAVGVSALGEPRDANVLKELRQQRMLLEALSEKVRAGEAAAPALTVVGNPEIDAAWLKGQVARGVGEALDEREEIAELAAEAEAQPSEVSLAAFEAASSRLSQGLANRRWTQEDAEAVRREASQLTHEQRVELVQRMAMAVNSGQLAIEAHGPPL